jgi:glycerate 2-kinase
MDAKIIIQNRPELATSPMRQQALDIIEAGIARVLPDNIMQASVQYEPKSRTLSVAGNRSDLSKGKLFVIGGGKASGMMAGTLEDILGPGIITAGIVTTKRGTTNYTTNKIEVVQAGHPIPDEEGVDAVHRMLDLKSRYTIDANDVIICLISGGGSALMPCPAEGISLSDKQAVTGLLLACGAEIAEINVVRKHLSQTKGGRLGRYFAPATVISLILSDVIGNDLSVIASGPTYPDQSTFDDALKVLGKYHLLSRCPANVMALLKRGVEGRIEETPKVLDNCRNFIIGDINLALAAMKDKARELGLNPYIVTAEQKGETTSAAVLRSIEILANKYTGYDAIILGGETTPSLPSDAGKGGRNQHYAAESMRQMMGYPGNWVLASVGTDGSDFLPDVAGAIVDNTTLPRLVEQKVDVQSYLDKFDSFHLLEKAGEALVRTGNTGTNVGDVVVYLLGKFEIRTMKNENNQETSTKQI